MVDFERLGAFYLGRAYDLAAGARRDEPILYDARDLTTHAVCVGMTGSGKTGLCVALLEEAALDGIPALVIDPKGDLANLLLTFPDLRPADFLPWIDPGEAERAGRTPEAHAAATAAAWRAGLADWGQEPARIARLRGAADFAVYTPGSSAGLPLSLVRSFAAPPPAVLDDPDSLRDRIGGAASGLLALLGIEADPLRSREQILLATLLDRAWRDGRSLDLAGLIREVQSPPVDRIGAIDLESFYPGRDRFELAMRINNLLASPGFAAWMEGEPLDVGRLLHAADGRPRIAVLSIAHLSDAERMFFVTLLLHEVIAWMRGQPGTGSLRAILYMDEIFGYFPPTAAPPAKAPMLALLKQARAFGLGVVLATQNPVDLDYKGLANAGSWFLGRLQTERDKARVLEGLEGVSAGARGFDRQAMEATLAGLGNRVFLLHNVHDDAPVVFQTRWTMSYLRGPLTREQIRLLTRPASPARSTEGNAGPSAASSPIRSGSVEAAGEGFGGPPVLPPEVPWVLLAGEGEEAYRPFLLASARLHFVSASAGVDHWDEVHLLAPVPEEGEEVAWDAASALAAPALRAGPGPAARFAPLPSAAARPKSYAEWRRGLAEHLYRARALSLWQSASLGQVSRPGEGEGEFRGRLALAQRERRDAELDRLRQKYAPKIRTLQDKVRRAEERLEREDAQVGQVDRDVAISIGATVLGALFGRKLASMGNVGRATTAARRASRAAQERQDVGRAREALDAAREDLAALEAEFRAEAAGLQEGGPAAALALEALTVRPRKSDTEISRLALAWVPAGGLGSGACT